MATIQLLLLDDHTLFQVMLSRLLETESAFRVVAHTVPPVKRRSQRWGIITSI
jgi:DNA-binding NarL/FixJ family response regulator